MNKTTTKKIVTTTTAALGLALAIFGFSACSKNDIKETNKETDKEIALETIKETETEEELVPTKLSMELKMPNYDIKTSSPILARIMGGKDEEVIFTTMDVEPTDKKDIFIVSKMLLQGKGYTINMAGAVNKDGSVLEFPRTEFLRTMDKEITKFGTDVIFTQSDKVTKEQLEFIVSQVTHHVERGDETLIKEKGKKAIELVNKNIQAAPISKIEKIKPVEETIVQEKVTDFDEEETIKETSKNTVEDKETVREITKNTQKEIAKETVREKVVSTPVVKETVRETQAKPKPAPTPTPKPVVKEPVITTKTTTSKFYQDFNIIDNYASTGAKSRVYREGQKGIIEKTYKITYKDGVQTSKVVISEDTIQSKKDKIIERYIKIQDKVVSTKQVDDKNSPIYDFTVKDRWFVKTDLGIEYFYSSTEARARKEELGNKGHLGNWGTAEPEITQTLIGYEKKTVEVVTQEEQWAWKR